MTTIWLHDIPETGYHSDRCECTHHCRNCFTDIRHLQTTQTRRRYCSDYCQNRMARERALDRLFASAATAL